MNIVSRIYVGHIIVTDDDEYTVTGTMQVRSRYKYIVKNRNGTTLTLDREDILQAQKEGSATVK